MVEAKGRLVAVLKRNRPAFYVVSPELMTLIAELYDERHLSMLVESRLASVDHAVKFNRDDL
jgi:PHD/YefM family antitoxin component YafN of YafNO toxin-antitoxin module